jgi:MFS family permease
MELFSPDILDASRMLPVWLTGAGFAIGLLLWFTGWWGHRFWVVLVTTLIAGVVGLKVGPVQGMRPLVAGLLCAIAAGVLALSLVRVVAFAAGGSAICLAAHSLIPRAGDAPLAWFLVGGLFGLLLFRLWVMVLTSFIGSLVAAYGLLSVLDHLGQLSAVEWAGQRGSLLNGICLGAAALGVVVQYLLERRRLRIQRWQEEEIRHITEREQERLKKQGRGWLDWGKKYRRAG